MTRPVQKKPIPPEYWIIASIALVCLIGGIYAAKRASSGFKYEGQAPTVADAPRARSGTGTIEEPATMTMATTGTEVAATDPAAGSRRSTAPGRRPLRRRGTGISARPTPRPRPSPGATNADGSAADTAEATPQPAVPENVARASVMLIGTDPNAEIIFSTAVDDPGLSSDTHREMIESLSTLGFADPNNPTQAELALINTRLALIERLAPNSLDDTNFMAFENAYAVLGQMAARLGGGGAAAGVTDGGAGGGTIQNFPR